MATILLLGAMLCITGCAVPLGPGYRIERQEVQVRYVSAPTPHLRVRTSYRLRNIGDRPLEFIPAVFPRDSFGRANLSVWIGKDKVSPEASGNSPQTFRIPFAAPWLEKQRRELTVEYDLDSPGRSTRMISVRGGSFHLGRRGWYPVLEPPEGIFTEGGQRPEKTRLEVRVPRGFRVHAAGRPRGTKKQNDSLRYRFEVRPQDYRMYLIAGRYLEQQMHGGGETLVFWTRDPLPSEKAQRLAARIAAARETLRRVFGPRLAEGRPLWLVECRQSAPEESASAMDRSGPCPAASDVLPFDRAMLVGGNTSSDPASAIKYRLAYLWFTDAVTPEDDSSELLAGAFARYGLRLVAEAQGSGASRGEAVAQLLKKYEELSASGTGVPLSLYVRSVPKLQREIAVAKADLFVYALEDRVGSEPLGRGLAHMLRTLRGQSWDREVLRAALEESSRQDLAGFFRAWLDRTGVPDDFRARYPHDGANATDSGARP